MTLLYDDIFVIIGNLQNVFNNNFYYSDFLQPLGVTVATNSHNWI